MTLDPIVQRLIAALPPEDQLTFAALAEAVYSVRFTGFTGIHWKNGVPKQLDLGAPVKLSIVDGLDSGAASRAGS